MSAQSPATPRVSVLLPCFNAARFLDEALQSLESQTFTDFEISAVDDGSTDETVEMLRAWTERMGSLRVEQCPHRGLVAALNTALDFARGELVARFDADDIAHPARFQRQVELLGAQPEVVACGTGVKYFPDELVRDGAREYQQWINALQTPEEVARDMFVECPIAHPTLMARRAAVRAIGGYQDCGWPEDYDLVLRLWQAGHALANAPEVLHQWRERNDRLSRTDPRYSIAAFVRCKVNYLKASLLQNRDVVIWGAGPVGKSFARELLGQNVSERSFIDVDARKIGRRIHDVDVIAPADLPEDGRLFVLAAVANQTARNQIRTALNGAGLTELRDYCAVA